MFFDVQTENSESGMVQEILEIAALQKKLLLYRYEPEMRLPIPLKERRKGLFGRELVFPEGYQALCEEVEKKKRILTERLAAEGRPIGPYWWNLSWEELIPILLSDLTLPDEEDTPDENGRRHAYEFDEIMGTDGCRILCLKVQEHRQGRTLGKRHTSGTVHSSYTAAEREKMEQAYADRRNMRMLTHMAVANERPVYSVSTNRTYQTAVDYYSSGEGLADYMRAEENYHQSLYTELETNHLSVSVESSDSRWLLGVAQYHVDDDGRLDYMEPLDFRIISGDGGDAAEGLRSIV